VGRINSIKSVGGSTARKGSPLIEKEKRRSRYPAGNSSISAPKPSIKIKSTKSQKFGNSPKMHHQTTTFSKLSSPLDDLSSEYLELPEPERSMLISRNRNFPHSGTALTRSDALQTLVPLRYTAEDIALYYKAPRNGLSCEKGKRKKGFWEMIGCGKV